MFPRYGMVTELAGRRMPQAGLGPSCHLCLPTGRKAESIRVGMARTGGMVVITVLLSVAMFLLVLGLIIALIVGARK